MPNPLPTRQDDEEVIEMLALRDEGYNSFQIARYMGCRPELVRTRTNNVYRDERIYG